MTHLKKEKVAEMARIKTEILDVQTEEKYAKLDFV